MSKEQIVVMTTAPASQDHDLENGNFSEPLCCRLQDGVNENTNINPSAIARVRDDENQVPVRSRHSTNVSQ